MHAATRQPRWSDFDDLRVHHREERGERRYSVVSLPDNTNYYVLSAHRDDADLRSGPQYYSTHTTLRCAKDAIDASPREGMYSEEKP